MVASVAMAIGQSVLLVMTWGISGPATVGTKPLLTVAQQQGARALAKASLQKMQIRLADAVAQGLIKKAAVEATRNIIIKQGIKFYVSGVTQAQMQDQAPAQAFDAITAEILKKREQELDSFNFATLDLTGIATAAGATTGGAHPVVEAAAWMRAASLVDPTGWVAAAAAFTNPMCHDIVY